MLLGAAVAAGDTAGLTSPGSHLFEPAQVLPPLAVGAAGLVPLWRRARVLRGAVAAFVRHAVCIGVVTTGLHWSLPLATTPPLHVPHTPLVQACAPFLQCRWRSRTAACAVDALATVVRAAVAVGVVAFVAGVRVAALTSPTARAPTASAQVCLPLSNRHVCAAIARFAVGARAALVGDVVAVGSLPGSQLSAVCGGTAPTQVPQVDWLLHVRTPILTAPTALVGTLAMKRLQGSVARLGVTRIAVAGWRVARIASQSFQTGRWSRKTSRLLPSELQKHPGLPPVPPVKSWWSDVQARIAQPATPTTATNDQ